MLEHVTRWHVKKKLRSDKRFRADVATPKEKGKVLAQMREWLPVNLGEQFDDEKLITMMRATRMSLRRKKLRDQRLAEEQQEQGDVLLPPTEQEVCYRAE